MCLIVFANRIVPGYELVLIANRDEFLKRPTARLAWWEDHPDILAGRDLIGGGTWLGINKRGEWTAITNYREPLQDLKDPPSRGILTKNILENNLTPLLGHSAMMNSAGNYHGFNLLSGDRTETSYFSNRSDQAPSVLKPGFYGLSNHLLDTPWPKVRHTKASFEQAVGQGKVDFSTLFELLGNEALAKKSELPDTGVPPEWEKLLSAAYINAEQLHYGTRLRTILTISEGGLVQMCEWTRGEENQGPVFSFQRS